MTTLGPNSAGTGADDATVGTLAWSNPDRVVASDDSKANASSTANVTTHYLKATNFGFTVPVGATINGITVEVERMTTNNAAARNTVDNSVRLVVGGTITGDDKADAATKWPIADAYATYGGASTLWGLTPTVAQVNASDFGVVISATTTSDGATINARIDHIRITIDYTAGSARRTFVVS